MSWSCLQVEERLSDHLDGALTAAEQREFNEHVAGCAKCAPLLAQVTFTVGKVHTLEAVEAPGTLVSNILDQTLGPRKAKRSLLAWIPVLWQPRFAMGAATVLATLMIILQATAGLKPNSSLAALSPSKIYGMVDLRAHRAFARSVKFVNDLRVVYEIQSRLQPATSAPPPAQQTAPATPPAEQRNPNESRQDKSSIQRFAVVAVLLENTSRRSAR
jgi:anti-sigma factor RsiW